MKLPLLIEGERRYAVAIRDGSDLWLTLWVRCSQKAEYFVLIPRADRSWDPHMSYHRNGTLHMKSFGGRPVLKQQRQPLTGPFKGTEHLGAYAGHGGKSIGAVCDPTAFSGVIEAAPGVLGPSQRFSCGGPRGARLRTAVLARRNGSERGLQGRPALARDQDIPLLTRDGWSRTR
jgi:hypothetical protein